MYMYLQAGGGGWGGWGWGGWGGCMSSVHNIEQFFTITNAVHLQLHPTTLHVPLPTNVIVPVIVMQL